MAHDEIKDQYDQVQAEGLYEEGMARMALYHRHCQDPVIFRALGDVRGKSLLDLACGDDTGLRDEVRSLLESDGAGGALAAPIRNAIRCSAGRSASRPAMPRWISTAQATASTTLANSTSAPSPMSLTIRPWCSAIAGSMNSRRWAFSRASVPASSAPMSRL